MLYLVTKPEPVINKTLVFIANELNSYLNTVFSEKDKVIVSSVTSLDGSMPVNNQDKMILTLINIEQETVTRNGAQSKIFNNTSAHISPALNINLYLLFSASFNNYEESLKFISATIAFFQGKAVFTHHNSPALDPGIEKLILELERVSYQDWSYLWGMLGGKYIPSMIYKTRMLTIQQGMWKDETPLISNLEQASNPGS